MRNAEERLANLRIGRRPAEVDAAVAQAEQAKASRELSQLQLKQQQKLFDAGFISSAQLDIARANFERDLSRVTEAEAQGRVALQSLGREAEIRAAQADVDAARAALAQAAWRQAQRAGIAPAAAMVQDTFFVEGEWVPAGRPVAKPAAAAEPETAFLRAGGATGFDRNRTEDRPPTGWWCAWWRARAGRAAICTG